MKQILSLEQAKMVIKPYKEKLYNAIESAFHKHLEVIDFLHNGGLPVKFTKTAKATNIHEFIKAYLKKYFVDRPDINIGVINGIFGILIENQVFIRFKKMDKNFFTSNIQTIQTKKYGDQDEIFGLGPNVTFLYCGYVPDPTFTFIKNIHIVCKHGDSFKWNISVSSSSEQMELSFDDQGKDVTIISRVKLKEGIQKIKKTS